MGSIANRALSGRLGATAEAGPRCGIPTRLAIYLGSCALCLLAAYLVGKDMGFDTLSYHLYAGFSGLHDRFGQDYFPAGPQSYFNPYVYVPFYLLVKSGLPAIAAAGILAVAQSGILWLTFEIALQVSPSESDRSRMVLAVCALALAFANPILINQFGSSYADVTTAELVLGGWLLLVRAVNRPGMASVACAGLLLGVASALKLTNAVHAVAAILLALFISDDRHGRTRYLIVLVGCMAVAFVVVCAPWSLRLEHHFGDPLFPVLNGFFRSPQLPTDSTVDYRFIPSSAVEALWRPFEIMSPAAMVDDEIAAADSRYALLLILTAIYIVGRALRRVERMDPLPARPRVRALTALGCGFLLDWMLWLGASGNGRYFISMACVAAVLVMGVGYLALARWPRIRRYVFVGIFCFQAMLLTLGASLGGGVPWSTRRWFDVSVPAALGTKPALYFLYGDLTNSFIVPFLPRGSGFINLAGSYVLRPDGANGARIDSLIRRYAPDLSLILRDPRNGEPGNAQFAAFAYANDALEAFGLRADPRECARIAVRDVAPGLDRGYLLSCRLVADPADRATQSLARRGVDVIFDRLEDACPDLFRPRRPFTEDYSIKRYGQVWARRYSDTGLMTLVGRGVVQVADRTRGGPATFVGLQSAWADAPLRLECWRRNGRYYERMLPTISGRSRQ